MDFFTSDTHAFHLNIMRYSKRPFKTIELMNQTFADNINKVAGKRDRVFHLGDVAFGPPSNVEAFRAMINCGNVFLIYGNHDKIIRSNQKLRHLFSGTYDMLDLRFGTQSIVMCHYALRTWNKMHYRAYHLYGHSHGTLPDNPDSLSIDVGVDTNLYGHTAYTPYSLDEIHTIMNQKNFTPIDRHTGEKKV